jgi:hypothetical protein
MLSFLNPPNANITGRMTWSATLVKRDSLFTFMMARLLDFQIRQMPA